MLVVVHCLLLVVVRCLLCDVVHCLLLVVARVVLLNARLVRLSAAYWLAVECFVGNSAVLSVQVLFVL